MTIFWIENGEMLKVDGNGCSFAVSFRFDLSPGNREGNMGVVLLQYKYLLSRCL